MRVRGGMVGDGLGDGGEVLRGRVVGWFRGGGVEYDLM